MIASLSTYLGYEQDQKQKGTVTAAPISLSNCTEAKSLTVAGRSLTLDKISVFHNLTHLAFDQCPSLNEKSLNAIILAKRKSLLGIEVHHCKNLNPYNIWNIFFLARNLLSVAVSGESEKTIGVSPKLFLEDFSKQLEVFDVSFPYEAVEFSNPMPNLKRIRYPLISMLSITTIALTARDLKSFSTFCPEDKRPPLYLVRAVIALTKNCRKIESIAFEKVKFYKPEFLGRVFSYSLKNLALINCFEEDKPLELHQLAPVLEKNPGVNLHFKRIEKFETPPLSETETLRPIIGERPCTQIDLPPLEETGLYLLDRKEILRLDPEGYINKAVSYVPGTEIDQCQIHGKMAIVGSSQYSGIYLVNLDTGNSTTLYAGKGKTLNLMINASYAVFIVLNRKRISINRYDLKEKTYENLEHSSALFVPKGGPECFKGVFLNKKTLALLSCSFKFSKEIIKIIDLESHTEIKNPLPAAIKEENSLDTAFIAATDEKETPLATVNQSGEIHFWDIDQEKVQETYRFENEQVIGVEVLDQEKLAVITTTMVHGKADAVLSLVDRRTKEPVHTLPLTLGDHSIPLSANMLIKKGNMFSLTTMDCRNYQKKVSLFQLPSL